MMRNPRSLPPAARADDRMRLFRLALLSVGGWLFVAFSIPLVPLLGEHLHPNGPVTLEDVAIVAVLGGAYLAPFVAGIVLARHVIVRRPPFGTAMLAWVGLVGNVGVILAAIALLLLELLAGR